MVGEKTFLKVEFVRNRCANKECGVETDWWLVNGELGQTVCPMCYAMLHAICDKPYWQQLHCDFLNEKIAERERIDRLRPGGEYFPGDDLE